MATVPFTGLQDQPAAPGTIIPDDMQRISSTPDDFGAAQGQGLRVIAGGLQDASQAADTIQTRYDQTATANAFSQLRDKVTANSWGDPNNPNAPPGMLTQQGDQAMRAYPDAVSRLQQAADSIGGTLSPAQQRVFQTQAQSLITDTKATYDQHRAVAQQQWQVNSLDAQTASAQQAAIAGSDDPTAFAHGLADARNAIVTKASTLGWSPEQTTLALADATSKTSVGVTEKLAVKNPQLAWAYYQQHQGAFTGSDQLAVESRLRPQVLQWGSRDDENRLFATFGGNAAALPSGMAGVPATSALASIPDPNTRAMAVAAAAKADLPAAAIPAWVSAVHNESSWNLGIHDGSSGEIGAGQVMPATGAGYINPDTGAHYTPADLRNPQTNLVASATVFADQWNRSHGDVAGALRGYNGGNPGVMAAQPYADRAMQRMVGWTPGAGASSPGGASASDGASPAGAPALQTAAPGGPAPPIPLAQVGNPMPLVTAGYGSGGFGTVDRAVIGDSLGVGLMHAGNAPGIAQGSIPPRVVANRIAALPDGALARVGQVVISTGLSNSGTQQQRQADLAIVQQQIDAARAKGATNILLAGVGERAFPGTNAAFQDIATRNGINFTGPAPTADAQGVHPGLAGYRAMLATAPIGPRVASPAPVAVSAPPGSTPSPEVVADSQRPMTPAPAAGQPGAFGGGYVPEMPPATPDSPHDSPAAPGTASAPPVAGPGGAVPATPPAASFTAPAPAGQPVAAPAPAVSPPALTQRPNIAAMLEATTHLRDPFGQLNPVYQETVASRIRARARIIEFGQAQADRSNRDLLLSGAMGYPPAGAATPAGPGITATPTAPPEPPGSAAGVDPTAPTLTTPAVPATSGAPVGPVSALPASGAKPTTLDQLLATPEMRQAWASSTPEMQHSILTVLEHNSHAADPPENDAAMTQYYKLRGQAADNPGDFKSTNLADPALLATMPHHLMLDLMNRQASISANDAKAAQRGVNILRAQTVTMPDARQAGLMPNGKPGSPEADAWANYTGRLDDALQQFQATNARRPNDDETKKLGQSLLTQGWLRDSGSLWGALPNDTSTRLYQAQTTGQTARFYPNVPASDRTAIVSSFTSRMGRAPTAAEVEQTYMLGRQPQARPGQVRPPAAPQPQPGSPGAPSASSPGRVVAPTGAASPAPASPAAAPLPMAQRDADPADAAVGGF